MEYKEIKCGTPVRVGEIIYYKGLGGLVPYKIVLIHKDGGIDVCQLYKDAIPVRCVTPTIFLKGIYAKFL